MEDLEFSIVCKLHAGGKKKRSLKLNFKVFWGIGQFTTGLNEGFKAHRSLYGANSVQNLHLGKAPK